MTDEIAFSWRLSYEDALKVGRLFRGPRKLSFPLLFLIGMLLALAGRIVRAMPTMTATEVRSLIALFTVVLPILGCIGWFLYWVSSWDREKIYLARSKPKNGTCAIDGIRLREEGVTVHIEWKALSGFSECDGMLFLLCGKKPFPLAPYMFQTPEDWDRVRSLIGGKLNPIPIKEKRSSKPNLLPVTL